MTLALKPDEADEVGHEGEATMPPDPRLEDEQFTQLVLHAPGPPTPTDALQSFAFWFASNVVGLLVAAVITSYAWNALINLHRLTTLNLHQAFALMVIVRVMSLTVRL